MNPVDIIRGSSPIVLSMPHTGTFVPDDIARCLNDNGRKLADTDWHINRLYADLLPNVTIVTANFHRYVIDANRDPNGHSLYPGQNTTSLVPLTDFYGIDIWNTPPTKADITNRCDAFHTPYHHALRGELTRIRELHGTAILFDCHSIRSDIPFLFNGILPDFNIGTNVGQTCDARIERTTQDICETAQNYTSVLNGRFKGGWTTRHYGQPADNIHAIQMELAQSTYLAQQAAPWMYDVNKANIMRLHLSSILNALTELAPTLGDLK